MIGFMIGFDATNFSNVNRHVLDEAKIGRPLHTFKYSTIRSFDLRNVVNGDSKRFEKFKELKEPKETN